MKNIFQSLCNIIPVKNNVLTDDSQYMIIAILPASMILLAFYYNTPIEILNGMITIINANDVFATDYTYIANMGTALFNSGILVLINIYIIKRCELKLNGMIISALFMILGFAFIGKNIYNVWPFYIGGYIYSRVNKIHFKNIIVTTMYCTSLAPIISVIAYTFAANKIATVLLSYLCGSLIGFVMPEVSSRMIVSHGGYNIYNTGFAAGFFAIVVNSIFNVFGKPISPKNIINPNFNMGLFILFTVYFILLIIIGYLHNKENFSAYRKLISYSGKLITDFTRICGFPITIVNMGIMGLISVVYIILMDGGFNGATVAGLLAVVGFSSFGKHPRNTISILIGIAVSSRVFHADLSTTTIIISALFGTTLAPMVGDYGFIYGLILGPLHLALVTNIGSIHTGLNLYNNGLSGGIVAMTMVPILDAFKLKDKGAN